MLVKYTVQMYGEFFFQIIQGEAEIIQKCGFTLYDIAQSRTSKWCETAESFKTFFNIIDSVVCIVFQHGVHYGVGAASSTAKSYLRFSFVWYLSYQRNNIHILKIKPKFCNKNGVLAYWEIFLLIVIYYCLAYTIHYR